LEVLLRGPAVQVVPRGTAVAHLNHLVALVKGHLDRCN
jgi:hypothetical protein